MKQRRFPRLKTRVPLLGKPLRMGPEFQGQVMNMSEGGFSFETHAELSLGQRIEIEITTPEETEGPNVRFEVQGQVRWCSPSQEVDDAFWIGVMFDPPDEPTRQSISDFVRENTVPRG